MSPGLRERIDYGRGVRVRALCLMEAHGLEAEAAIRSATADAGLPAAERCFLQAVADRIARLSASPGPDR